MDLILQVELDPFSSNKQIFDNNVTLLVNIPISQQLLGGPLISQKIKDT